MVFQFNMEWSYCYAENVRMGIGLWILIYGYWILEYGYGSMDMGLWICYYEYGIMCREEYRYVIMLNR